VSVWPHLGQVRYFRALETSDGERNWVASMTASLLLKRDNNPSSAPTWCASLVQSLLANSLLSTYSLLSSGPEGHWGLLLRLLLPNKHPCHCSTEMAALVLEELLRFCTGARSLQGEKGARKFCFYKCDSRVSRIRIPKLVWGLGALVSVVGLGLYFH